MTPASRVAQRKRYLESGVAHVWLMDVDARSVVWRAGDVEPRTEQDAVTSEVAAWPAPPRSAGALLEAFQEIPTLDEGTLRRLEEAHGADRSPEDPWRGG